MKRRARVVLVLATVFSILGLAVAPTSFAQQKKPNIVVIMSDDVGIWNISAYHRGMMGGRTPNIDRIAAEGALFTDYYAQQSCTAGRAAFILGQTPFRTGLLMVGLPGAKQGLQDKDPTIAELLKPYGYATAQIGKNHLGDRNEYLPTVHGFDEFYGMLYHLNAMEEPYQYDYPKLANFKERFGPRNIISTTASSVDDPTTDPRWGRVGKQVIKDEGPLPPHPNMDPKATTNMEDIDTELVRRSTDFIDRSVKAGKPFFLWHNSTRMHVWTHLSPKWENKSGYGLYADGMMELDWVVERGARAILVRPAPVPGYRGPRSFALPEFDPFWQRVVDHDVLVAMHSSDSGYARYTAEWDGGDAEMLPFQTNAFSMLNEWRPVQDAVASWVIHGALFRHPQLKVAVIESGSKWLFPLLDQLADVYKKTPESFASDPVEEIKNRIHVSPFYEDGIGDLVELIGVDRVLYGSDYPHPEGLAQPTHYADALEHLPQDDQAKIMGGNLSRLVSV